MHIIVVGGGKVGVKLVQDLNNEGHEITVIDQNAKVVEKLLETCDVQGVVGSGIDLAVQKEAGVESTDMFIAVTPMDELNIVTAVMAKELGAKYTVSRVRNPEYFVHWDFMRDKMGVNMMINPELEAARHIDNVLSFPSIIEMEEFSSHQADMVQVKIPSHSNLAGLHLKNLNLNVNVCAVLREDKAWIPSGDYEICGEDALYITGDRKELTKFCKIAGMYKNPIRSALIIGGGRITYYLLKHLSKSIDIKVIETKEVVCEKLSADFPHIMVIHGDGTDPDLLKEESISNYDAFISLTGVDEENILLSLYAHQQKVEKIITKVNRQPLLNVVSGQGLQTIITPKVLAANMITQAIRAKNNAKGNNIRTFHRIAEDKVEVLEFVVKEDSRMLHQPLRNLSLKENVIFAYIVRGAKLIFPKGDDILHPQDRVVIVTTIPYFDDLEDVLDA